MSPIASIPAAFALSTVTPSVALDPDSAGQSASTMSQYLAGTGGLVFAAVAIVSVAGYFYHGRGTANNPRKNSTWATFSSLLSAMRYRGSGTTTVATGSDWPPDVEGGFEQHVSMVYARFFHPTFWNLVECHPATTSAPAIYVEDEAGEIPALEPKPYGMNSFLSMDDDDEGDGNGDGGGGQKTGIKAAEKADQGAKPRKTPPYDTSSATHVRFKSAIIGATDRPGGAFLCVPGKHQDGSSDASSSDTLSSSELDMACSSYDGTPTDSEIDLAHSPYDRTSKAPPRMPDGTSGTSSELGVASELAYLTDSQEFTCSPYGGILTRQERSSDGITSGSELDLSCSPYDGIVTDSHPDINNLPCDGTPTAPMKLFPSTRRYGMADMAELAQTLKSSIQEDGTGFGLVRTIGRRSGLCDLTDFDDTDSEADSATSYRHLEPIEATNGKAISSIRDVGVHDDLARGDWSDSDMFAPPHKGPALMRRILEELRDPNVDCTPRALSEDSDFELDEDEDEDEDDIIDDDEGSVPQLTPTWGLDELGRVSLEWSSSNSRIDCDLYDVGSIYPLTPPVRPTTLVLSPPCVYKPRMAPLDTFWSDEEVQVIVPTCSDSPLWLPSRPYVRTHRRRPLAVVCGPTWLPY